MAIVQAWQKVSTKAEILKMFVFDFWRRSIDHLRW